MRQLFNALFTNNGLAIAKFADEWSKAGREQQKNFLRYIVQLLEQAIQVRYKPAGSVSLPEEEGKFVAKVASLKVPFEGLGQMIACVTDTIGFIEYNAHSKTQLHALAIRLQQIVRPYLK